MALDLADHFAGNHERQLLAFRFATGMGAIGSLRAADND